jgi:hypothetical protein
MKRLEENVDIELGINEELGCWHQSGVTFLKYSGMISGDTFSLIEHGAADKFRNQMFFPADKGNELEIHTSYGSEENIRVFRVENVNPQKVVLRYLGMK